jgi:hypothetical protein
LLKIINGTPNPVSAQPVSLLNQILAYSIALSDLVDNYVFIM